MGLQLEEEEKDAMRPFRVLTPNFCPRGRRTDDSSRLGHVFCFHEKEYLLALLFNKLRIRDFSGRFHK